jgi:hypothetical protein
MGMYNGSLARSSGSWFLQRLFNNYAGSDVQRLDSELKEERWLHR